MSQYRDILKEGEKSPPTIVIKGKRGRQKKSKSRNLLEHLQNYEDGTLRFMENENVPFTNNLGGNDLRMAKVQQKYLDAFEVNMVPRCFLAYEVTYRAVKSRELVVPARYHYC